MNRTEVESLLGRPDRVFKSGVEYSVRTDERGAYSLNVDYEGDTVSKSQLLHTTLVRPAEWDHFVGAWCGYDGSGLFCRLVLTEDKTGIYAQHIPSLDSTWLYRVELISFTPADWELVLRIIPLDKGETFTLTGRYFYKDLRLTAEGQGRGWKMGVHLLKESEFERNLEIIKKNMRNGVRGRIGVTQEAGVKKQKAPPLP